MNTFSIEDYFFEVWGSSSSSEENISGVVGGDTGGQIGSRAGIKGRFHLWRFPVIGSFGVGDQVPNAGFLSP